MTPTNFPEANCVFGPPPGLDESQIFKIPAYRGVRLGGNLDGSDVVVVAWTPTEEEIERLKSGYPVFVSMVGGLAPHFLTTDFKIAIQP